MTIEQLQSQLNNLCLEFKTSLETNEDFFVTENKFFGKKGSFNILASVLKDFTNNEEKKAAGQLINQTKTELIALLQASKDAGNQVKPPAHVDLTQPALETNTGNLHPITQAINEITDIFAKIGFTRVRYPEVDTDHFVFEALNMPPTHPARDEWETFFVENPTAPEQKNIVMTTHTSNGQPHEMLRLNSKPPIRMINIGRCYRRQQDQTHTQMFHQFEGFVVDEGINISHLKGVLDYFAQSFYGPGTKSRLRPYHFQFTEPSFEIDFSCNICGGTTQVTDPQTGTQTKCKFCKSGWHEVGGAGMTHPNVLRAGGIDPEKYTGFAFGWGVERTYTLRPGLNIDDIRQFYSGDLDFLKQF